MSPDDEGALARGVLAGEKRSVAKALNFVESRRDADRPAIGSFLDRLERDRAKDAGHRVGFTGPPGVGKSTLASATALELRKRGRRVGIVAVDPTSLVSGGSLLGDRARMGALSGDDGVFVRSYATAGEPGGVTSTALASIAVMGAAYDVVLVETVGVGQTETDVRMLVDTVALVLQPGSGDTVQFLKAGIMEIPDLFVVQKADHEALATRALGDLGSALRMVHAVAAGTDDAWRAPALATSALHGRGVDALVDALFSHRESIADVLVARRARGSVAWAIRELERVHGRHGIEVLGGRDALRAALGAEHASGASAFALASSARDRFIATFTESARAPAHEREPS